MTTPTKTPEQLAVERKALMAKISYIPLHEIGEPNPGISLNLVDRWWVVDPKRGALIYGKTSPQCNIHKSLAESIRDRLYPGLEVRLIHFVSLPCDPHDYA